MRDDRDGRDEAVYVISVAAELAGMHPQTLRGYERKGLVAPTRTVGNTRRYSRRDVERLRLIQRLTRDEGLNLAGVQMVLDMHEQLIEAQDRTAELEARLDKMAERLREEVEAAHRSYRFEIVPAPGTAVVPHPVYARRRKTKT